MKLRESSNRSHLVSSNLRSQSFRRVQSQKEEHLKVKQGRKCLEVIESTPSCSSIIMRRRSSFSSSSSSVSSTVTPITSLAKFSLTHRSNNSSGYYSIHKSKSIANKNESSIVRRSARRLNIAALSCDQFITKTMKKSYVKSFQKPLHLYNSHKNQNSLSSEFWTNMIAKESIYIRDSSYFRHQSFVNPQMRSVLVEWMKEVCDAYSMEIETFYLAVDYIDRYLSVVNDIQVHSFQAIGTTCLFIAAKLNEIRPPRVESLANVTDGASNISEILLHESHILLKLNWQIQPISAYSWLKLFLQISQSDKNNIGFTNNQAFEYQGPLTRYRYLQSLEKSYLSRDFLICKNEKQDLQYMDLLYTCIRDVGSLRFSYAVIAASIVSVVSNSNFLNITDYSSEEVYSCKKWLRQFFFSVQAPLKESVNNSINFQGGILKIEKVYSQMSINSSCYEKDKENIPPVSC